MSRMPPVPSTMIRMSYMRSLHGFAASHSRYRRPALGSHVREPPIA